MRISSSDVPHGDVMCPVFIISSFLSADSVEKEEVRGMLRSGAATSVGNISTVIKGNYKELNAVIFLYKL